MEAEGMFDSGEFDIFDGIAGETTAMVIVGNWNERTRWYSYYGPVRRIRGERWVVCHEDQEKHLAGSHVGYFVQPECDEYLGGMHITIDDTPARLLRVLERLSVKTEWSDVFLRCECGRGFRTQPDSYSWEMYGWIGDGDYMCGDCLAAVHDESEEDEDDD
jgi:hypothetical protein